MSLAFSELIIMCIGVIFFMFLVLQVHWASWYHGFRICINIFGVPENEEVFYLIWWKSGNNFVSSLIKILNMKLNSRYRTFVYIRIHTHPNTHKSLKFSQSLVRHCGVFSYIFYISFLKVCIFTSLSTLIFSFTISKLLLLPSIYFRSSNFYVFYFKFCLFHKYDQPFL